MYVYVYYIWLTEGLRSQGGAEESALHTHTHTQTHTHTHTREREREREIHTYPSMITHEEEGGDGGKETTSSDVSGGGGSVDRAMRRRWSREVWGHA